MAREASEMIWVLMQPGDTGEKDYFGKEVVPPLPLSFDRVNAGRPPRSTATLFTLPYEILGLILGFVSSESLATLALVNRDCLQWARSRQFRSIRLDYSYASSALVAKLRGSFLDSERHSAESGRKPSIGDCIRRVIIATDGNLISRRHGLAPGWEELLVMTETKSDRRMVEASEAFFGTYISMIQKILIRRVMPNLELLSWEDSISLPHSFLMTLASSTIRHLKLPRISVTAPFAIEPTNALPNHRWPLETLHMSIYPPVERLGEFGTSPISASILRLCAPTLRILRLETTEGNPMFTFHGNPKQAPGFPCLRSLTLGVGLQFANFSPLEAFVQDELNRLIICNADDAITKDFIREPGQIPGLETFVWQSYRGSVDHLPHLFRANPQITKIALPFETCNTLLEAEILPALSHSFSNLTSLSLFREECIPESSLEMIASLCTLTQIHLSSGRQIGRKLDWFEGRTEGSAMWQINHALMRKHLGKLLLLKKLAFSRDTYDGGAPAQAVDRYYEDQYLPAAELPNSDSDRDKIWEQKHRKMILDEAKQYIDIMTKLEWLYFGQMPMQVAKSSGDRIPEPLPQERDSCWTLLTTMFGGNTWSQLLS